jgi:hypothetical protein
VTIISQVAKATVLIISTPLAPKALSQVQAWGIAPGLRLHAREQALKARLNCADFLPHFERSHLRNESRFQRYGLLAPIPPGAVPQAASDIAPSALMR